MLTLCSNINISHTVCAGILFHETIQSMLVKICLKQNFTELGYILLNCIDFQYLLQYVTSNYLTSSIHVYYY